MRSGWLERASLEPCRCAKRKGCEPDMRSMIEHTPRQWGMGGGVAAPSELQRLGDQAQRAEASQSIAVFG